MGRKNNAIDIEKDGIDYINMYSKAKTEFGRMLSNFYKFRITTPEGTFASIEAYWYYLSLPSSVDRDSIRNLYGYMAKKKGRELRLLAGKDNLISDNNFENKILTAIRQKITSWKNNHSSSDENFERKYPYRGLPIIHYYTFDNGDIYDVTKDFPWLINGINQIVNEVCYK